MADHCELAFARPAPMNISIPATHRTLPRTKISAGHIDQWLAKGGASGLIANERPKNIAFLKEYPARDTDCFLALANVNPAGDLSSAIKADQFFFERARQKHPAKRLQKSVVNGTSRRRFLGRSLRSPFLSFSRRRLKHSTIFAATLMCAKHFLEGHAPLTQRVILSEAKDLANDIVWRAW
jgi:hypothetical protein